MKAIMKVYPFRIFVEASYTKQHALVLWFLYTYIYVWAYN